MRISRAALAATVLAAGLGSFSGTAFAEDACNNDASDQNIIVGPNASPTLRVGIDDPTTGYPGVVVVCAGALGDPEILQVGGGVYFYFDSAGDPHLVPMLCLPDCDPI